MYINPEHFREVFAADVSAKRAAFMAAAQRPGTLFSLFEPSGVPGRKTIPSWYLVACNDKAVPPTAQRTMAARAGAHTIEIASSHDAMISHPNVTSDLILAAARSH